MAPAHSHFDNQQSENSEAYDHILRVKKSYEIQSGEENGIRP